MRPGAAGFPEAADLPATIHRTEITAAAKTHFHNRLTETYYILQCEAGAAMALDGKIVPGPPRSLHSDSPGRAPWRHRTHDVLIIVFPKFDPDDEVIVEDQESA